MRQRINRFLELLRGPKIVDNGVPTLVQEMGLTPESEGYWEWTCIYPVYENVDGELVLGLHKNWSEFFGLTIVLLMIHGGCCLVKRQRNSF